MYRKLAEVKLHLNQSLDFTNACTQKKMERWIRSSLGKSEAKVKRGFKRKLKALRLETKPDSMSNMARQTMVKIRLFTKTARRS